MVPLKTVSFDGDGLSDPTGSYNSVDHPEVSDDPLRLRLLHQVFDDLVKSLLTATDTPSVHLACVGTTPASVCPEEFRNYLG
jgi:hypothetical protein